MKITNIEAKKNKIEFSIEGDTHTIAAALRAELATDNKVKAAGYHIEHPQLGKPRFIVETDGAEAGKTVANALKKLSKQAEKLAEEAHKELR